MHEKLLIPSFLLVSLLASSAAAFVPQAERTKESLLIERPAASPRGVPVDRSTAGPLGAGAREFLERHGGEWILRVDPRTRRADLVRGSGIPLIPGAGNTLGAEALATLDLPDGEITLDAVGRLAGEFVQRNASLVAPDSGRLVLDRETSSIREDGRLISVYFRWEIGGVPVEGARVFVRANSGNVTQFGAPLVGSIDIDTIPVLGEEGAWRALLGYTGDDEIAQRRESALVIQPEEGSGGALVYRLVWKLTYRIFGGLETWEGRVDAATGEVVGFRDTNAYMRVVGGVYPRTVFDGDETRAPMPFADVTIGNAAVITDSSGAYAYSGGEVQAALGGHYQRANCLDCLMPIQPYVRQPAGSGFVDFGFGGLDNIGNGRSTPADRNSVFHLTQVQRIGLKWLPSTPWLSRTHLTAFTNYESECNAGFSGDYIITYRSGGGCNNTGEVSDVLYHEYGHGIDSNTRPGDPATGEGTGDVVSMHLTHSALIGPGFHVDGSPVRDVDPSTSSLGLLTVGNVGAQCPGMEPHCVGQIYGQTSWGLAQALVAKHGHYTGWRTSERVLFTAFPDSGGYLPTQSFPIYDAYLQADDDDGNLANGTPNGQEIFDAFDLHGIAGAPATSSAGCSRPAQPALTVTPQCDRFELSWSAVGSADHYEILRTELREDMAAFPVGQAPSGTTTFTDGVVAPGVDYWYVVMAVDASGCESAVESPVHARLPVQPILTVTAALPDDEPMGNRSGFADPGEDVDVVVTLGNFGETGATSVSGTIVPITPGVTMLADVSTWPALAVGGVAVNDDPIRFRADDAQLGCGEIVRLRLDPDEASGCAATASYIDVRLGEGVVLYSDDFETSGGWALDSPNSTATAGDWTRGVPEPTMQQPGADASPDGTECWFTGHNQSVPGDDGDIDDGVVILVSPIFDLSGETQVEYSYARWFGNSEPGVDPGDFFRAEVSDDGGGTWTTLETLDYTQVAAAWIRVRHRLQDFITLTDQVVFRFLVADGPAEGRIVEGAIDDVKLESFACDSTPACFVAPTFPGLESAASGSSCGEVGLSWSPATSHCANSTIRYNLYRSTDPGFLPDATTLVASGIDASAFQDNLLPPGQTQHYLVRAFDSRSGEDGNTVRLSATPPATPDTAGPVFGGLETAATGQICGETVLGWSFGLESCHPPVSYDVYRSTNPLFDPAPANLVGTTLALSFTDLSAEAGVEQTYIVRARDALGNSDANSTRITTTAKVLDRSLFATEFEATNEGWSVVAPNTASAGNWEWGDPWGTPYQPEDDASPTGVKCWVTGILPIPTNGDVDDGTTTLLSAQYNLSATVAPGVRYQRWFTNDRGSWPGEPSDDFVAEVSNDNGGSWTELERVGPGTPFAWVPVQLALPIAGTNQTRFRFTAADLNGSSTVEAGIDDFGLVDVGQGCQPSQCGLTPNNSCQITEVERAGDDVVIHWSAAAQGARRAVVYQVSGCGEALQLGSSTSSSFVHQLAALSPENFNYRITFVANCGKETKLDACVTTTCD